MEINSSFRSLAGKIFGGTPLNLNLLQRVEISRNLYGQNQENFECAVLCGIIDLQILLL